MAKNQDKKKGGVPNPGAADAPKPTAKKQTGQRRDSRENSEKYAEAEVVEEPRLKRDARRVGPPSEGLTAYGEETRLATRQDGQSGSAMEQMTQLMMVKMMADMKKESQPPAVKEPTAMERYLEFEMMERMRGRNDPAPPAAQPPKDIGRGLLVAILGAGGLFVVALVILVGGLVWYGVNHTDKTVQRDVLKTHETQETLRVRDQRFIKPIPAENQPQAAWRRIDETLIVMTRVNDNGDRVPAISRKGAGRPPWATTPVSGTPVPIEIPEGYRAGVSPGDFMYALEVSISDAAKFPALIP